VDGKLAFLVMLAEDAFGVCYVLSVVKVLVRKNRHGYPEFVFGTIIH
jgi:hypothetical protein